MGCHKASKSRKTPQNVKFCQSKLFFLLVCIYFARSVYERMSKESPLWTCGFGLGVTVKFMAQKQIQANVNQPTYGKISKNAVPIFEYEKGMENEKDEDEFIHAIKPFASAAFANLGLYALFTAAHVSDWVYLCIACQDAFSKTNPKFQTLYGTRMGSKKNAQGKFGKNDWSIIFLSEKPNQHTTTSQFCFDNFNTLLFLEDKGAPYSMCGYPNCLNTVNKDAKTFSLTSYTISNLQELSDDDYKRFNVNKEENIAFYFYRGVYLDHKTSKQRVHVALRGMSGCPILDKDGNLVAVFSECPLNRKILVGVRIKKLVDDLLSNNFDRRDISQSDEE